MLGKKKCPQCGNKVEKKFSFCPWCGLDMDNKDEDEFFSPDFNMGNMGFPFNTIFKQLGKNLEKEFKNMDKISMGPEKKAHGISIKISTGNSGNPVIKIGNIEDKKIDNEMGNMIAPVKKARIKQINISEDEAKKFAKLPHREPLTNVRRLADRIIYEIELPGVTDTKNIRINKMHNSIEIRAYSDDAAFLKLIPVALPIIRHAFEKGKLTLELKPEN
jgi:hypothetical protein